MTTHDDEHPSARLARAEIDVEATPEEVWEAIATGPGNAAWLFPAEIDGREGGAMMIYRQPYGGDASATVTAWDPPHRFAYTERMGEAGSVSEPWATEFLIEARSDGTCVVRVVSGFHRDGERWEDLVEVAGEGWRAALRILRAYLAHFAGQQPTVSMDATGDVGRGLAERAEVSVALFDALGLTGLAVGDAYRSPQDAPALRGVVEEAGGDGVLLRATEPGPGIFEISTFSMDGATVTVNVAAHLYGPDAKAVADREEPRWNAWLVEHFPAVTASR